MTLGTVRDKLWIWGHEAGSHNDSYGLTRPSRMTPAEGAFYLGVPNLIMVRYLGCPAPPFDQYAMAFRPLKRVVWSIVGASGKTDPGERKDVIELATRCPNVVGVMMDDFFSVNSATPSLSIAELQQVRQQLSQTGRDLGIWVVLYDNQLGFPVRNHLELCDRVTFWTWKANDLVALERNFEAVEKLGPRAGKLLGCYMWDYGQNQPMPVARMQQQCALGLRWLREGRIEGMIFLATCICDLELEAVEWTRRWIEEVGEQPV
jgi:hypothetical protein